MVVGLFLGATTLPVRPVAAQADACAIDPKRSLGVLVYSNDMPGEMMYAGARTNAGNEERSRLTDEARIGDVKH